MRKERAGIWWDLGFSLNSGSTLPPWRKRVIGGTNKPQRESRKKRNSVQRYAASPTTSYRYLFFFLLNSLCLLNKLGIYSQEACLCVLLVVMGLLGRLMVLELLVVDCFDGAGWCWRRKTCWWYAEFFLSIHSKTHCAIWPKYNYFHLYIFVYTYINKLFWNSYKETILMYLSRHPKISRNFFESNKATSLFEVLWTLAFKKLFIWWLFIHTCSLLLIRILCQGKIFSA